jgi:hypothetical protein
VAVVHVQRLGIVLSISPVQSVPGAFGVHPESLSSTLIKYHLFFLFLLSLSHVFVLVKGQRVTTWHCDVLQKKKRFGQRNNHSLFNMHAVRCYVQGNENAHLFSDKIKKLRG